MCPRAESPSWTDHTPGAVPSHSSSTCGQYQVQMISRSSIQIIPEWPTVSTLPRYSSLATVNSNCLNSSPKLTPDTRPLYIQMPRSQCASWPTP